VLQGSDCAQKSIAYWRRYEAGTRSEFRHRIELFKIVARSTRCSIVLSAALCSRLIASNLVAPAAQLKMDSTALGCRVLDFTSRRWASRISVVVRTRHGDEGRSRALRAADGAAHCCASGRASFEGRSRTVPQARLVADAKGGAGHDATGRAEGERQTGCPYPASHLLLAWR
jgi:hypothetical protein